MFVLIDALGWTYLQRRDFLRDLLPFRKPLRTVLGYSSGAIPAILTGQPPVGTGLWNLLYYNPSHSPFRWLRRFGFLPGWLMNHRVTRKLIKELGRHVLGAGPSFECCVEPRLLPWFDWAEKRDIFEPDGIQGAPSIFDHLAQNNIPRRVYTHHNATDAQILEQARRDIGAGSADFYFLYLCELDRFLHMRCRDDAAITERLGFYDRGLRQVFDAALRRDHRARLVVFSDHGMTPVQLTCALPAKIGALGWRMPEDYLAVYDSTMARFWFFCGRARASILAALEADRSGQVLPEEEMERLGVRFSDHRYGEVVFLLHPGRMFGHSNFNGAWWAPLGMHGYHPDDPFSDACFLSAEMPQQEPSSILDVYRLMREVAERR